MKVKENYAAECSKLVEELENSNPNLKFEWYHEGKYLYMTIKIRDKECSRYLTDFQMMYCFLDAFKVALQSCSLLLDPNGTDQFD